MKYLIAPTGPIEVSTTQSVLAFAEIGHNFKRVVVKAWGSNKLRARLTVSEDGVNVDGDSPPLKDCGDGTALTIEVEQARLHRYWGLSLESDDGTPISGIYWCIKVEE